MTRARAGNAQRLALVGCVLTSLWACDDNPPVPVQRVVHVDVLGEAPAKQRPDSGAAAGRSKADSGLTPNEAIPPSDPSTANPSAESSELPLETDFQRPECPSLDLLIDMKAEGEYQTDRGVLVQVLTRPEFTEANRADPENPERVPPEDWDRAEFPENACVVRLRGIDAECYTNDRSMARYEPPTDAGSPVGQASYHARRWASDFDLCDWPVPGCPRAQWGTFRGYWWYLTPRTDDALLVACAPSCEGFFRAPITLQLRPDGPTGVCDEP